MSAESNASQPSSWVRELFSFPHPANDVAARLVAGMVVALGLAIILLDQRWLLWFFAYEFLARVLTGPKLSLMGRLATDVLVPYPLKGLAHPVAGPPKRFAQGVGLTFSVAVLVLELGLDMSAAATGVLGVLLFFAGLEASLGFCAGCFAFGYLMRWGLVPPNVCRDCEQWGYVRRKATEA